MEIDTGEPLAGPAPSSESPMHTAVYREFDHGAVVHTHSHWSTIMAVLREPIPSGNSMLAGAGSSIPVAGYATYGTAELADNAVTALRASGASAWLLANHGVLVVGDHLEGAFETLDHVEFAARLYVQASAAGDPVRLSEAVMDRVAAKRRTYG